ncbi:uncharacterized protein LOC130167003 [Seriola aureovittata]|uniref:uncharacterized protein LOC130167003 n=1 Tax=Seriola aureovittata TaxID=2871759 RepID=UPI0024BE06B9|nr:uncharacterized protein LOC130167003 [Seriola aureovittata]
MAYDVDFSEHRSFTPESTISDWEGTDLCLETLFDESRPDSPQSVISDFELEKLFSSKALSPESVSSDFDFSLLQNWLEDFRSSSPESVSQSELSPLSPDSPVPQFRSPHITYDVDLSGHRSFTPDSTLSDWEGTDLCLETLFEETRPDSPQSVLSDFELEKLFSSRALSPESVYSDFDFSHLQDWLADFRASSPESVASVEQRSLYPQIPFGQVTSQHCNYYLEHSDSRPISPLSTLSDVEYSTFCLEELFDDNRADSPDSLTSQVESTKVTVIASQPLSAGRPLSYADVVRGLTHEKPAEALLSCRQFEFKPVWPLSDRECTDTSTDHWDTELRPHSPDSVVSQSELRPLSPDSPVPQYRSPHMAYDVDFSEHRSFTPVSTISDWEGTDLCLETLFDESRPDSPQSVISDFELEKLFSSRALSPESVSSDFDFSLLQNWLEDFRSSSPESVSQSELRPLSPDSPVPQFRSPHITYDVDFSGHRSFTPDSTFSDWEGTDLCLETLFEETRPDSPQSVLSDFELEKLFSSRALSPESVSSDFDFSHLQDWLADFRASSPESVASVEQRSLYPQIPFGQVTSQHCNYYLEHSDSRPVSPLSTLSDVEYSTFCLEELFDDNRADSPNSLTSRVESTKVTVIASQPLSAGRPLSYADVVRGLTHEKPAEALLSCRQFEFTPVWPLSDRECTDTSTDHWDTELRPHSPDSVVSQSELRPLSPDSPVPQFRSPHMAYDVDFSEHRSFTPESTISDWEGTDLCLETLFDESRPDSPQSVISDFELEKLFISRAWSPDVEHSTFCLEELFDDNRTDSPDSINSLFEVKQTSITVTSSPMFSPARTANSSFNEQTTLLNSLLFELEPFSAEDAAPVHKSQKNLSQFKFLSSESMSSGSTPSIKENRLSRKPLPNNLMSHVYDPLYKRKCSFCEIRASECTPQKQLCIVNATPQTNCDKLATTCAEHFSTSFPKCTSVDKRPDMFLVSKAVITDSLSPEYQSNISILQYVTADTRSSSPHKHAEECHFNEGPSLSDYTLSSPEILHSDDESPFYSTCYFTDQRPPSPQSFASVDEFTALSPDSQIGQFDCQPCYYLHLSENRSVSPDSIMLERDCSDSCLDTFFDEMRPDSPESIAFYSEFHESCNSMPSDNEYSQSFLDYWLAALRPPMPPNLESTGGLDEVLNQLPCVQNVPDDTVTEDKPVCESLMTDTLDPIYEQKYFCDKVNYFEDVASKRSEKACEIRFEDSAISMEDPHSPAKFCHFESMKADSKPSHNPPLSHSEVLNLTVTDSYPEMLMPPTREGETGPMAPSSNTNDQSFFVRPPPRTTKDLD